MDAGLLSSLREEVEVWKAKFQEQVEATATAASASAVPNGESDDSANASLDKALQDAAEAQEEASRWKAKAVAAQELEGTYHTFLGVMWRCLFASISSVSAACGGACDALQCIKIVSVVGSFLVR